MARSYAATPDQSELTAAGRARQWYENHVGAWVPYWDAMLREKNFLEGDRYERDHGPETRDRRLTQIRGQETQDTVRHVVAEMTSRPRSVEARGLDSEGDADAAEVELALVDQELRNPWKGFEARYYEALQSACERRLGVVWMDWEPDCGSFGEILYRFIPPDRILWDEAYDPHHPLCDVVVTKLRMPVDWIHENYKGSEWVKPDQERLDPQQRVRDGVPLMRVGGADYVNPQSTVNDGKAELWFFWYKNDRTAKKRETGKELALDPERRYLACKNGCGYRSPTQGELREQGKLENELPAMLEGCPKCEEQGQTGVMVRIDRRAEEEEVRAYSRGKRLVVIAPFNKGPNDEPLYDGKWPIPKARSFPGLFITRYVDPGKPMGPSDVKLMWDQQAASDNLRTLVLQRVFENRSYWVLPTVGIEDYRRQRFNFREDQYNVMYRDMTKTEFGPLDVEVKTAPALDGASWNLAFNAAQAALTQYRPAADLGLTPESSKNIAGVALEQLVQQGNVPIADFKRRVNEELGKFYGVVSDYIHATYTPRRLTRLNLEGSDVIAGMWGDDMPNFDFIIEETPAFTGLEKSRSEAFDGLMNVVGTAAKIGVPADGLMEIWAEVNNIPRSIVRKFQKQLVAAAEKMAQQPPPPDDMGGGEDELMSSEGFTGAGQSVPGMEPETVA